MNIHIISIDHTLQQARGVHDGRELTVRKDRLERLLTKEVADRKVDFITEESDPRVITIAGQVAQAYTPPIPWENISMSERERKSVGIFDALKNRPFLVQMEGGKPVVIERRIPEDEIYEAYLIRHIEDRAAGAESTLILCGDLHADALKQKLEAHGNRADVDHGLVEKRWV